MICEKDAATIRGVSVPLFLPQDSSIGINLRAVSFGRTATRNSKGHSQSTGFSNTIVEEEAERWQDEFETLREIGSESTPQRRAVNDKRFESLAFLFDGRSLDSNLTSIHRQGLPSLFFFGCLILVCEDSKIKTSNQEVCRGQYLPYTERSAFAAAAVNRGGITTGRYGSNSGPKAWQTLAQVAIR